MTGLRERQKASRKKVIIEAARNQFISTEYPLVTIESIAKKADVSPMTVFNYFGSKGGLLLALVNESDMLLVEKIRKHIKSKHSKAITSIETYSFIIIDHAFSYLDRKIWRHVQATAILEAHSSFGQGFLKLENDLADLLCDLIKQLEADNKIKVPGNVNTIATIIYNVHNARFIEYAASNTITTRQIKNAISTDLQCITKLIMV